MSDLVLYIARGIALSPLVLMFAAAAVDIYRTGPRPWWQVIAWSTVISVSASVWIGLETANG